MARRASASRWLTSTATRHLPPPSPLHPRLRPPPRILTHLAAAGVHAGELEDRFHVGVGVQRPDDDDGGRSSATGRAVRLQSPPTAVRLHPGHPTPARQPAPALQPPPPPPPRHPPPCRRPPNLLLSRRPPLSPRPPPQSPPFGRPAERIKVRERKEEGGERVMTWHTDIWGLR